MKWATIASHTHATGPWVCSTQPCPALPTVLREEASHPQQRPSAAPRTAPLLELEPELGVRCSSSLGSAAVAAGGRHTYLVWGRHLAAFWRIHAPVFAGVAIGQFLAPSRLSLSLLLSPLLPSAFFFFSGRCTELILVRNVSLFPNFFRSWFSLLLVLARWCYGAAGWVRAILGK